MAEIAEGEEVRAVMPVVEVVNPAAMRVRARVNQADIDDLRAGQPVRVGLDAYSDLQFDGRVEQISPLGVQSTLSPKVRTFIVIVVVHGSHPNLMPDLTASLDVILQRTPGALVVPRDAVAYEGTKPFVRVRRGGGFERQDVTIAAQNGHEVAIGSGLGEGAVVARHVSTGAAR
jgi:multidrug efflux pump subunit AcrA (membrane-fusion protein)